MTGREEKKGSRRKKEDKGRLPHCHNFLCLSLYLSDLSHLQMVEAQTRNILTHVLSSPRILTDLA